MADRGSRGFTARLRDYGLRVRELPRTVAAAREESSAERAALGKELAHIKQLQVQLLERVDALAARDNGALRLAGDYTRWSRHELRRLRAEPDYEQAFSEAEPLISVVIRTYKDYELLRERSVPSVLAQSYQRFEIVVVGDAAPDEARQTVERFDDPRITFFNLPYRGPYPTDPETAWMAYGIHPFNEGVLRAQGRWIALLDADDAFRPDHLERLLELARRDRVELAYGRQAVRFADGREMTVGRFPPELGHFSFQAAIYHAGLARIFEAELSDTAFGLPQDWGLCLRMMEAGVRIGMLEQVTFDYYPSRSWAPSWKDDDFDTWGV